MAILNFSKLNPSRLDDFCEARHHEMKRSYKRASLLWIDGPSTYRSFANNTIAEVAKLDPKPCMANVCAGSVRIRHGSLPPGMDRKGLYWGFQGSSTAWSRVQLRIPEELEVSYQSCRGIQST